MTIDGGMNLLFRMERPGVTSKSHENPVVGFSGSWIEIVSPIDMRYVSLAMSFILNRGLKSMETILVGSRGYGVNSDDDTWDYLAIVPENQMDEVLEKWREYEMEKAWGTLIPVSHWIHGHGILSPGGKDRILVISRPMDVGIGAFILGNATLHTLVHLIPPDVDIQEVRRRLIYIKAWARDHGFYGGAYPDGLCYLIFVLNTMAQGYTLERSMEIISNRVLYHHHILGYAHISHVGAKNLQHMVSPHRPAQSYHLVSKALDHVLHQCRPLLDKTPEIKFIENDGSIWVTGISEALRETIETWVKRLQTQGIDVHLA